MLSEHQEEIVIHGVKHVRVKRAPAHKQLPKFEQSQPHKGIPGNNSKIVPARAAELALEIKHLDSRIARLHRRWAKGKIESDWSDLEDMRRFKALRAKLQAERAYIMEQANPKKEPAKPKFRPMRRKPARYRKEAAV